MSDDNSDAVISHIATMAMLRAVLKYVERNDPTAHAWIDRDMLKAAADLTGENAGTSRDAVVDRARNLYYAAG